MGLSDRLKEARLVTCHHLARLLSSPNKDLHGGSKQEAAFCSLTLWNSFSYEESEDRRGHLSYPRPAATIEERTPDFGVRSECRSSL